MSQTKRLLNFLSDCQPKTTIQILDNVYGVNHSGIARISARILDLRKKGHDIAGWKDTNNPTIYWYQLKSPVKNTTDQRSGIHPPAQGGLFQQTQWTNY